MCAKKECFCFYPRTAGSRVNGVGHTKGEPSVEDLWKVFPHSPGDGVLPRHWEKDPMFTLKKKDGKDLLFDMLAPDTDLPSKT